MKKRRKPAPKKIIHPQDFLPFRIVGQFTRLPLAGGILCPPTPSICR